MNSEPVLIPYKVLNMRFMPLYGIITGSLPAYISRASYSNVVCFRYFHISSESHSTSNVVSTRGQITTVDWIPPLSRMIVMILTQLDETCGFKIQSSYKFSLVDLEDAPVEEATHAPPVVGILRRVFPL